MKKLFALALFLVALPALAQQTISNDYNAPQVAKFMRAMTRANTQTCARYGLPPSCTMPQARQQFCKSTGVGGQTTCIPNADPTKPPICVTTPLTSTCAGSTSVIIYNDLVAFHKRESLRLISEEYDKKDQAEDVTAFLASPATATKPLKDAWCASIGKAAGCLP